MNDVTQRPTVSVWIVAYNHERFIRQCLESVMMQQTDFDFDVIIGEDCSTDNTRAIIKEFEARYPNIIKPIYHDKNVGAYRNAYEYCYPRLAGKYIACLEADDYWTHKHKLQMQVHALENDKAAVMCFTGVNELSDGDNKLQEHWSAAYNRRQDRYSVTDVLRKFNIVTCTILFRNIYPQLPYNPAKYPTGDVSLSVFLLLKGDAIYLADITAVYRLHGTGIYSPNSLEKKNLVFLELYRQFLTEPLLNQYSDLLKVLYADRAYQSLCFEIKKPDADKRKIEEYYKYAVEYFSYKNLFYPLKTLLRKTLYQFTGKSFGRKL